MPPKATPKTVPLYAAAITAAAAIAAGVIQARYKKEPSPPPVPPTSSVIQSAGDYSNVVNASNVPVSINGTRDAVSSPQGAPSTPPPIKPELLVPSALYQSGGSGANLVNAPNGNVTINSIPVIPEVLPIATPIPVDASLSKLVGRWIRSDGGYMLRINYVTALGSRGIGVEYFNPSPIRVEEASVTLRKDGKYDFTVEMWDNNYPGSIYRLTFDPKTDSMAGSYTLGETKERFNAQFYRANSKNAKANAKQPCPNCGGYH